MPGPVRMEKRRADAQNVLSMIHWARLGSCSMRNSSVGPACWEWRASSVWMLEIMLAKLMSPESRASEASATNCTLVKPVSNVNGSWMATSTTLAPIIIPSNVARAAIIPQSLVWYALWAKSYWGSPLARSSWGKKRLSCVCRFFFQAEDGIRDLTVTGVQTCALPISLALHLDGDVLDVQHDVGDVLAHAGNRGEFVQHAVDMHRLHGGTLQRGQEDAPERIDRKSVV